jgi:hypothetical protein
MLAGFKTYYLIGFVLLHKKPPTGESGVQEEKRT